MYLRSRRCGLSLFIWGILKGISEVLKDADALRDPHGSIAQCTGPSCLGAASHSWQEDPRKIGIDA